MQKIKPGKKYVYCEILYNLRIPESFNTNISHQFFDYKKTLVNSQRKKTNSKSDFVLKYQFETFVFTDFWYTKINLNQIWYDKFTLG